jgi:predicted GIY-YIG superfamily endonuclease
MRAWYVYCLATADGRRTYIGATVDLERRLARHNGELAGGAKATAMAGPGAWHRAAHVSGFDKRAALQFEWRWKHLSRARRGDPLTRRMSALADLLRLERPTRAARPYAEYPALPTVTLETESARLAWGDAALPGRATIVFAPG